MNHPQLPPALVDRLEPIRVELRRIVAAIHRDPARLDLWRQAEEINRRQLEVEREFFAGKEVAA